MQRAHVRALKCAQFDFQTTVALFVGDADVVALVFGMGRGQVRIAIPIDLPQRALLFRRRVLIFLRSNDAAVGDVCFRAAGIGVVESVTSFVDRKSVV